MRTVASPAALLVVLLATLACPATRADTGKLYTCTASDGAVSVTTEAVSGQQCEAVDGGDGGTPAAAAGTESPRPSGTVALSATAATQADGEPRKDPREAYRDAMVAGAQHLEGAPASAANPATARRYLSTTRSAYNRDHPNPSLGE